MHTEREEGERGRERRKVGEGWEEEIGTDRRENRREEDH
jgi:hypothetical protein